jgi:hypothetical protein
MKVDITVRLLTSLLLLYSSGVAGAVEGLTDGLVAYWPLDGSAEEQIQALDLQPDAVQTTFAPGLVGEALQTREGNKTHGGLYLRRADALQLDGLREFTLSAWYRIDALGGTGEKSAVRHAGGALGWYNPDNNSGFHFITQYRRHDSDDPQRAALGAFISTRVGGWYHVVQRVDPQGHHTAWHTGRKSLGHARGAVAGQQLDEFKSLAASSEQAGQPLVLAWHETKTDKGGGRVCADEIALWNRALSDDEIQWLFQLGRAGHAVTSPVTIEELQPPPSESLEPLSDFGWTSPWLKVFENHDPENARTQAETVSTGEMAIATAGSITIERRFPGVSSGNLKVEYRVRPQHVTIEVNSPGASVMKFYLSDSQQEGSWTMRWHYPWAWPAIGGNTVPRFYVADGGGGKRKGLEYTDILIESKTWYTVATVLDCDNKTWEFWVDGQKFDTQVNLGRPGMRWWKTSARQVDNLRINSTAWQLIDALRVYHDDKLIASTDFTTEEGYVPGRSIFEFE